MGYALLVTGFCLLLGYPLGFMIATTTPTWATLGFIFVLLEDEAGMVNVIVRPDVYERHRTAV